MDVPVKVFLFFVFLLSAATALETDYITEADENTRHFILEQNELMKNLIKEEIQKQFASMSESFDRKVGKIGVQLEASLHKMSASFGQNLSSLDSKMERSHQNLAELFTRQMTTTQANVERSLEGLSQTFEKQLVRSESKVTGELKSLNERLRRNHQQLSSSVRNLNASLSETPTTTPSKTLSTVGRPADVAPTSQPPVQMEVEEVSGNNGTIEFIGRNNSSIRRKIWVLTTEGKTHRKNLRFVMEENNLGEDAHLSLWSSFEGANIHVWNGSQTDWRKERTVDEYASLILLTLVVKPSANPGPPPSFKLTFTSSNKTSFYEYSGEIMTMRKEGVQSVSFPPQNAHNYSPYSAFQAVIAPQSGKPFSLTLKYVDVPGTPPECDDNHFWVYFLEESPTETNYERVDPSSFSRCGNLANVSQFIGTSTVGVVRFSSGWTSDTGKGFRLEVKPN